MKTEEITMSESMSIQKVKFSTKITSQVYQKLITDTLGAKKKAERYTAAIMSSVATNQALQECVKVPDDKKEQKREAGVSFPAYGMAPQGMA
jgi:hypothetical protein